MSSVAIGRSQAQSQGAMDTASSLCISGQQAAGPAWQGFIDGAKSAGSVAKRYVVKPTISCARNQTGMIAAAGASLMAYGDLQAASQKGFDTRQAAKCAIQIAGLGMLGAASVALKTSSSRKSEQDVEAGHAGTGWESTRDKPSTTRSIAEKVTFALGAGLAVTQAGISMPDVIQAGSELAKSGAAAQTRSDVLKLAGQAVLFTASAVFPTLEAIAVKVRSYDLSKYLAGSGHGGTSTDAHGSTGDLHRLSGAPDVDCMESRESLGSGTDGPHELEAGAPIIEMPEIGAPSPSRPTSTAWIHEAAEHGAAKFESQLTHGSRT